VTSEGASFEEARLHVARWIGSESQAPRLCLLDERGGLVAETAAPPDVDGLRGLARRLTGSGCGR